MKNYIFLAISLMLGFSVIYFMRITPSVANRVGSKTSTAKKNEQIVLPLTEITSSDKPEKASESIIRNSRDEVVAKKLDHYLQKTAHITAAKIKAEKEKIAQGLRTATEKNTPVPKVITSVDVQGNTWQELYYESGIVRYLPIDEGQNI